MQVKPYSALETFDILQSELENWAKKPVSKLVFIGTWEDQFSAENSLGEHREGRTMRYVHTEHVTNMSELIDNTIYYSNKQKVAFFALSDGTKLFTNEEGYYEILKAQGYLIDNQPVVKHVRRKN